ncbi:domain of Kin17 curved DNA-binding protein-domain-containing protein [Lipomyces japonicus]|uniref:domain of Kin17 curved DNA-binding protein-domain-containing protein n=1 Tax=Lipomyces japonicus TaxID=56871 RepID=UPI0034CFB701
MGRAEVGTPKYIANKMKAKGLQRLRWYCQVCEKQCRDENGFRCHTQSESHVRQMLIIGENPQKKIAEFSQQFKSDFVSLLRSSHGEKPVNFNRFYQEYISDKNHVHMNATKWATLSEFVNYLGSEGVIKVEDDPQKQGAFMISWIDNSPDALKRKQVAARRDNLEQNDLDHDQRLLSLQIKKANFEMKQDQQQDRQQEQNQPRQLQRNTDEKIKLSFTSLSKPLTGGIKKSVLSASASRSKPLKLK